MISTWQVGKTVTPQIFEPHIIDGIPESASVHLQPTSLSLSLRLCHHRRLLPPHLVFPTQTEHRGELLSSAVVVGWRKDLNPSWELKPIREPVSSPTRDASHKSELSRRLSQAASQGFDAQVHGPTASSFGNSSLYSGKGFPTTGPRIEAGNVVIHRGLHVSNVTASCSLCAIGCKELFTDRHRCPDVRLVVEGLSYVEEPVQILDRKEQVLRNKTIPLIKVLGDIMERRRQLGNQNIR
ncbi:uncharacterized protein E6C27_scaffold73G00330 [Cucumis melo var. makuwa]|uniref:Uncharacterized protein n=1 Tax=Cucumis melo var. makuwa TaxID=1194695 RepID=A0A5A7UT55_CUCMM|nr:uncharacterized protein E6C27_scaffold73G00330 [Cucumis melo var. makuwa]